MTRVGGKLDVRDSAFREAEVRCENALCAIEHSHFERTLVDTTGTLHFRRNRVEAGGAGAFRVGGEPAIIENNLFLDTVENRPSPFTFSLISSPGSLFRYNTIVNTSAVTSATPTMACLNATVSDNIFAGNSSQPLLGECIPSRCLFDTAGAAAAGQGTGNTTGNTTQFFVDPISADFRLALASPAIGLGQSGLVTTDLDGRPRPQPAGSTPDAGAFESPK
jgi:hypothetical protein